MTTEISSVKLLFLVCCFWIGCTPGNKTDKSVKFQQYYVEGEVLYKQHCANCHQADGSGLGRLYPPLNQSDYMDKSIQEVICLIKYGKEEELLVNGVMYNQPMKGVPVLTDLEIAEIATYIYNSWNHDRGLVEVAEVSTILNQCSDK